MENSRQVNGRKRQRFIGESDRDLISTLPDELMHEILSKLPGKDAVKTSILSKRWVNLWKCTPNLKFNHRGIVKLPKRFLSRTIKKAKLECSMANENGGVTYSSKQIDKGKVDVRIQREGYNCGSTVFIIEVSDERHSNYKFCFYLPTWLERIPTYCSPSIVCLELNRYRIHPEFRIMYCESLKTLRLNWVFVETRLLNSVLAGCASLQELIIQNSYNIRGGLFIRNKNLTFLKLACIDADKIQVLGMHLEVLVLDHVQCPAKQFVVNAPTIKFNDDYRIGPHIYAACNISSEGRKVCPHIPRGVRNAVGDRGTGYELLVNNSHTLRNARILAINFDFKKQTEHETLSNILKECVHLCILEVKIKQNEAAYEDKAEKDGLPWWILKSMNWEKRAFAFLEGQLESVLISGFTGSTEETGFVACLVSKATCLKSATIYFKPCAVKRATKAAVGFSVLPKASKNLRIQLKPEACEREILNDVMNYIRSFGF